MTFLKSLFDKLFRRTQQVRDVAVNHPYAGSNPAAEANTTPWSMRTPRVKFDSTNTIVLTGGKKKKNKMVLTPDQMRAMKIDDLRDIIKTNRATSIILRDNVTKPKKNIERRVRKLYDKAAACIEKSEYETHLANAHASRSKGNMVEYRQHMILAKGTYKLHVQQMKERKGPRFKEGKYDEYHRYMAEAKELAKTLRGRRTRPFNSELHYKRTVTIRVEQRACHLAYGYLKGKAYSEIEDNPRWKRFLRHDPKCGHGVQPDWPRVRDIIIEHSVISKEEAYTIRETLMQKIELWRGN